MRCVRLASAILVGSSLALCAAGCGGSKSNEEAPVAAEGEGEAEAPPPAEETAAAEPAAPAEASAPAPAPAAAAPRPAAGSGATDELLQLAQSAPASTGEAQPAAGEAPAAGGPAPAAGPGMGMGMGQGGPPAGYPGMSGGPMPPGMAGGPTPPGMGMGQGGPPAGYPGMSGGPMPPGMTGMGQGGPPAGYPGMAMAGGPKPPGMAGMGQTGPMAGYPGMATGMQRPGGPGGEEGFIGPGGGGGGSGSLAEADFSDPVKGAESFLSAVQAKDPNRLAEAVALRSPTEAEPKHQKLFQSLLERTADPSDLDDLAAIFQDMKVSGINNIRSTAVRGIILSRQQDDGDTITRTLHVRREKAGWKVRDFSNPRLLPGNPMQRQQRRTSSSGNRR